MGLVLRLLLACVVRLPERGFCDALDSLDFGLWDDAWIVQDFVNQFGYGGDELIVGVIVGGHWELLWGETWRRTVAAPVGCQAARAAGSLGPWVVLYGAAGANR